MSRASSKKLKLLNEEEIAKRRNSVEEVNLGKTASSLWSCMHCDKTFVNETRFLDHYCREREKAEQFASSEGLVAYSYYKFWMKSRGYGEPSSEAFKNSKFFNGLYRFSEFIKNTGIPNPEKYIQIMIEHNLNPTFWTQNSAYVLYLDWYDKIQKPLDQVIESIERILSICERDNVKIQNVFEHLGPQQILDMIRKRHLSPWFLFCSPVFGKMLKQMDEGHLKTFNAIINATFWVERFKNNASLVKEIKSIIKEVKL
jgi:hypothetical protein